MLKRSEDNIHMMTITVGDLMRKKVDTIEETASIQETAKKMKDFFYNLFYLTALIVYCDNVE
jgi:predicted transcriptional regulator